MEKNHFTDLEAVTVEQDAKGIKLRWLITEKMGANTFVMRHFEIAPGGYTPRHTHEWEHEAYILSGTGVVFGNGRENEFKPGDAIFMPGGEDHQFKNTGDEPVTMLCLIPARKSECLLP